jgi:hypothetical protein
MGSNEVSTAGEHEEKMKDSEMAKIMRRDEAFEKIFSTMPHKNSPCEGI